MRKQLALRVLVATGIVVVAAATADTTEVRATLETEPFFESDDADADDPAISGAARAAPEVVTT